MKSKQGLTRWEVLRKLDTLNEARRTYEQATDAEVKQQADQQFADCYDWLTTREVPIYYDTGPKLWLPGPFPI